MSDTYEIQGEPDGDDAGEAPAVGTLPLDAWHRERGGRMVEFAGYWMPVQYDGEGGGIIAEHLWTRENAGLFDVSHMGQLTISGEGAAQALEELLPIDLATLKPGRVRYSLLLDDNGGILDDLMVTNTGSAFYLVVNGATKWDDIAHLREHLPDEVEINHWDEAALIALQGPRAAEVLASIGVTQPEEGWPLPWDYTFMQAGPAEWNGVALGISRSGYTGEDGFEISVGGEHAEALVKALTEAGVARPIGLGARDSLRLEAGLPLYGHDLSPEISPIEAGLAFGINKRRRAEGGFMGAERVLAELAGGAPRARVGLTLEGRQSAREGAKVFAGAAEVGVLTSGGFAPSLGHPIAMAMVAADHAVPGTELAIEVRGKRLPARVAALPFVPHRYHR